MHKTMKIIALCKMLNGREIGRETNPTIEQIAKENNLVIVYGYGDDGVTLRGAIKDFGDCSGGGTIYLDPANGTILRSKCDDYQCPYFARLKGKAPTIKAVWCAEPDVSWTYETEIPHIVFSIMEEGSVFCHGIIFCLEDLD